MEFSGTMWLMIILKVTKNLDFTLSLEDTFFEKPWREGGRIDHLPSSFTVKSFPGGFNLV